MITYYLLIIYDVIQIIPLFGSILVMVKDIALLVTQLVYLSLL